MQQIFLHLWQIMQNIFGGLTEIVLKHLLEIFDNTSLLFFNTFLMNCKVFLFDSVLQFII